MYSLQIIPILSVCFVAIYIFEATFAQNYNERERFSRTRFLPAKRVLNKPEETRTRMKPLFKWDAMATPYGNHTKDIALLGVHKSQRDARNTTEVEAFKNKKRKRKIMKRYDNELASARETKRKRRNRRKKKKLDELLLQAGNDDDNIFLLELTNMDNNTNLKRNKKKAINDSLEHFSAAINLNAASKYNKDKPKLLIKTSTNRFNELYDDDDIPFEDLVQITKLNRSSSVIFKGDDKNKHLFSDVARKFENTLSLPKINYDKKVENVSIALLLDDLSLNDVQKNNLKKFDNRKDAQKARRLKSRCRNNRGGCDHFCHDDGPQMCSCLEGFILEQDAKSCSDVNECSNNNAGCQYSCYNTPGSYYCDCPKGLRISSNLKTCEDINECLLRNGHGPCQDTCRNVHGSYVCSCLGLKGTKLGKDKHTCRDIDECLEGNSGCSHGCVNTLGTSFCTCPNGMELSADWKTCHDVDECEDEVIVANCKHGCKNTIGSYECLVSKDETQNDEKPHLKTCPELKPPKHGYLKCLDENSRLHATPLNQKFEYSNALGTLCELLCPIGLKNVGTFKVVCTKEGFWKGETGGHCETLPRPRITCPDSKIIHLNKDQDRAMVKVHPPKTNVDWKYVKGYPDWIKELKANLLPGHHTFSFVATDPETLLTDWCSFDVIVKKPFYY